MKKDKYGRYIYSEDCENDKKDWALEDIRFCMRRDLTRNDIALALERTCGAVVAMRQRIKRGDIKI